MRDFLGHPLTVGDIVATVVFRAPGHSLGWRMQLARITQIDDQNDPFAATCYVQVINALDTRPLQVTMDSILFYSADYRDAHNIYLNDVFKDWTPNT